MQRCALLATQRPLYYLYGGGGEIDRGIKEIEEALHTYRQQGSASGIIIVCRANSGLLKPELLRRCPSSLHLLYLFFIQHHTYQEITR